MAEKLTDRTAKTSSFANDDVIHVVDVSDTSQDPAGSSFKSALGDIYGSYLAPKITSAQIVTNAADTYSLTLSDSSSSNHYLFLQTDSGDPFVDVTVTSYASPKDGAILVIRLNRAGTDDLSIPGFSAGSGFSAGIYTARYSSSAVSWLPVNYSSISAVNLQTATDNGNTTTNDIQFGAGSGIILDNGSILREGTTDAGTGGNNGIAQICGVGYELKWEAGSQYVMNNDGTLIREVNHKFNTAPAVTNDDSEGFYVGSRWVLDDGTIYTCTDDTTGAAVWDVQFPIISLKVSLSAAEIKTLNSVPIDIGIPSSGVGYYWRVTEFEGKFDFNTVAFTSTQLGIGCSSSDATIVQLKFTPLDSNVSFFVSGYKPTSILNNSFSENDTITLRTDADSAVGDSTIDCYISVQKVKL
jgi:hypothetical protein